MIGKKMQDAINKQINAEIYSANLYLSMAAWFDSVNLKGFANWMRVQDLEEFAHAMKFFDYLLSRQGKVTMKTIEGPPTEWKSPLDAFEAAYAHEQKVTAMIDDLMKVAREENDNASQIMLQWFITEQIEEEDNADGIVQRLKLMGDAPGGLFMIDRELATRVFTPPATGAAT